jgi:hypothetical protein
MPAWRNERSMILRITEESSTISARILSMVSATLRFHSQAAKPRTAICWLT